MMLTPVGIMYQTPKGPAGTCAHSWAHRLSRRANICRSALRSIPPSAAPK